MLAAVALTAFIIALVLILVGGLVELRTEIRVAVRDRVGVTEWVWIILPVVFLFAVCVFAAEHGLRK